MGTAEFLDTTGGSQDAVIGQLVLARWRDEGGKALDEGKWFKDEVRCAITERSAQFVHNAAIGGEREALVRDRRTGDIATEVLQPGRLVSFDPDGGVQAKTLLFSTQLFDDDCTARHGGLRKVVEHGGVALASVGAGE